MASVFKPKGSKTYTVSWFDADGRRRKRKGYTDRAASQQLADRMDREAQQIKDGLLDPVAQRRAEAMRRPIAEHLDGWRRDMEARELAPRYITACLRNVRRVLELAGIGTLRELTLPAVQKALGALRTDGHGLKGIRHHAGAVKTFVLWCKQARLLADDPLGGLSVANPDTDPRRPKRCPTVAEVQTLINATMTGPQRGAATGRDRALVYWLAAVSGLRVGEIKQLRIKDFDLTGPVPGVRCRAAVSKNRQETFQPLPDDLVAKLADYFHGRESDQLACRLPGGYADAFQSDLKASGIEYQTGQGAFTFHSLRMAYINQLIETGTNIRDCMRLARHSDPRLTMQTYGRVQLTDQAAAVRQLPTYAPPEADDQAERQPMQATGTTGAAGSNPGSISGSSCHSQQVTAGRMVSLSEILSGGRKPKEKGTLCAESHSQSSGDTKSKKPTFEGSNPSPPTAQKPTVSTVLSSSAKGRGAIQGAVEMESSPAHPTDDPDLTAVCKAWADLPQHIKAAISALVGSAGVVGCGGHVKRQKCDERGVSFRPDHGNVDKCQ